MRRIIVASLFVSLAGFLAFVIVPSVLRERDRARRKRTEDLATIRQGIEDYGAEHGVYPAAHSIEELSARLAGRKIQDRWGRPSRLSMRDPWGNPWLIDVTPTGYAIRTLGSDGKPDPDGPRGPLRSSENTDRDTIILDGRAVEHPWSYGGGGDEGGSGSVVRLGRGATNGKIIFDYRAVDVLRDGRLVASLLEAPARFEGPAGSYEVRVRDAGVNHVENVIVDRGKVRHHTFSIAGRAADATPLRSTEDEMDAVHLSIDGPVEIEEASVVGWTAVARNGAAVIAISERFPALFFLQPGKYTLELVKDGEIRSSKSIDVVARSEQWVVLRN